MSLLQNLISRGLLSGRPSSSSTAPGRLYHATDTDVESYDTGSGWADQLKYPSMKTGTTTANKTLSTSDPPVLLVDNDVLTITLPAATTSRAYWIANTSNGANNTVMPSGTDTIKADSLYYLAAAWDSACFVPCGTYWMVF